MGTNADITDQLDIERIKPLEATVDEVKQLVQEDKKQRFTLIPAHTEPEEISNTEESAQAVPSQFDSQSPSDWKIRANQGHTVILATNDHLTPMTAADLPAFVIHGTYYCFWKPILESGGLSTMNRNHIHFTTNLPEEGKVLSGSRLDAQLFIFVDVRHALQGGIRFWKSSNGVILTEGNENGIVPMQYVDRAQPRKAELGLLWENGKLGQELPEDLANARPPQGKDRKKPRKPPRQPRQQQQQHPQPQRAAGR